MRAHDPQALVEADEALLAAGPAAVGLEVRVDQVTDQANTFGSRRGLQHRCLEALSVPYLKLAPAATAF